MNQLTSIFKLLSDETRLRMLMLLYHEELCVCELSGILNVPQPRISKNLARLRDLNLVTDVRKEKFVFYSLKGNHRVLMNTLDQMAQDIELYPQLKQDLLDLGKKDSFLDQCTNTTKKL